MLLKVWALDGKRISVINDNQEIRVILEEGGKLTNIPFENISGIPRELFKKPVILNKFLESSYIKLSNIGNNDFTLYVNLKIVGGGNTIDPENDQDKLWPQGIIPYEIDSDIYLVGEENRQIILEAMATWNDANTGFKFVPRVTESNYIIVVDKKEGCNSSVGCLGGVQYVICDFHGEDNLKKRSIMHELGHVIGLYNEHQRSDSAKYVFIKNTGEDFTSKGKSHGLYDFTSIMHHGFSKDIIPKSKFFCYRDYVAKSATLSQGDKTAVAFLYEKAKLINKEAAIDEFTVNLEPQYMVLKGYAELLFINADFQEAYKYYRALYHEYGNVPSKIIRDILYKSRVIYDICIKINKFYAVGKQIAEDVWVNINEHRMRLVNDYGCDAFCAEDYKEAICWFKMALIIMPDDKTALANLHHAEQKCNALEVEDGENNDFGEYSYGSVFMSGHSV